LLDLYRRVAEQVGRFRHAGKDQIVPDTQAGDFRMRLQFGNEQAVEVSLQQRLLRAVGRLLEQDGVRVGIAVAEILDDPGHRRTQSHFGIADPQPLPEDAAGVSGLLSQRFDLFKQRARLLLQYLSRRRQANISPVAIDETHAQHVFEPLQLLGHRRLRDIGFLRGSAEAEFFRKAHKVAKLAQFNGQHPHPPNVLSD